MLTLVVVAKVESLPDGATDGGAAPRAESVLTSRQPICYLPAETAARSTIIQIYEGINQIQRVVIARQLLKD
jgi:alkylation response protein AidB-like acyl-CoA dehydrogenase